MFKWKMMQSINVDGDNIQGTILKWSVQKHICYQLIWFYIVFIIFSFDWYLFLLKWFFQEMLSYRPGTANDLHCGLNQFLLEQTVFLLHMCLRRKVQRIIYSPFPGHLECGNWMKEKETSWDKVFYPWK